MDASVQIGLLLALATAFASVLGLLYKHRGATESPLVDMRRPVRTSLALFRSRWYTLGIVVALAGWGLHVGALALAPISLVQSVIAGGLVLLTVTADRLFAHEVTRRQWIGVGLAAVGLAFLAPRSREPASRLTRTMRPPASSRGGGGRADAGAGQGRAPRIRVVTPYGITERSFHRRAVRCPPGT
jgi:hypothetical protein